MANYTDTHEHPNPVLDKQEARQGVTLGHMRYVLGVSLTLAVIAGIVVYFSFF